MTTPTHCPGFETFKDLKSFLCRCSNCGAEKEIFSDEFNIKHNCPECHQPIDFHSCEFYAGGEDQTLR